MPRRLSFPLLRLEEQPVLFLSLVFIGGLLAAAFLSVHCWLLLAGAAVLAAGFKSRGTTAVLLAGIFCAGGALMGVQNQARESSLRRFLAARVTAEEPLEIRGTLDRAPELAPDRIYLSIAVEEIAIAGQKTLQSGRVQISVPFRDPESRAEYDALAIDYGSRIRWLGSLGQRPGFRNPGAPDFDELLEYRGFDATGWVKSPLLIERLESAGGNPILAGLYSFRARSLRILLRSLRQPGAGILAAALFGNRHFLSQGAADSFRAGGTFHLLIISGSHFAMISLLAMWLVARFVRRQWLRIVCVLATMWGYALMIGLESAIARSVTMLTIGLAGLLVFRTGPSPNTLGSVAVALLAWEPRDVFNPAFQLTYLTVAIIVLLSAPLYSRIRKIGEWQPTALTPYPPRSGRALKWIAEILFWNEREFQAEMKQAHIRFRLDKARFAIRLNRWRLQPLPAGIVVTLLVTTAIQIGLLPLMIVYFHRFSVVAFIANVIESLLISLLMAAGAVFLALHWLIGDWSGPIASLVDAIGRWSVQAGDVLLRLPRASFRVPDLDDRWRWLYIVFFLAMSLLIVCVNEWNPFRKGDEADARRRRIGGCAAAIIGLCLVLSIGSIIILHPFPHRYAPGRLAVTFLDVGQGDAMLIRFPQGKTMLLDSGGRLEFGGQEFEDGEEDVFIEDRIGIGEAAVMPYLWHLGLKRLDWIVASHADADHVAAFNEIVRGFEIGGAIRGVSSKMGPDLFDRAVLLSGARLDRVKQGDGWEVDGVRMDVLWPPAMPGAASLSDNDESIVLRVRFGRRAFLLTGDIEKTAERFLLASQADLRADVLKVAHHGSRTSSTAEFLDRVAPAHAVISAASPSPFGHPHPDVLARLKERAANIWRTSHCGAITFTTDGEDLQVETFVKCESGSQSGDNASRSSHAR